MVLLNKVETTLEEGLVGVTEHGERVLLTEPILIQNIVYTSTLFQFFKGEHARVAKDMAQQELRGLQDYCQMGQAVIIYPTENQNVVPISVFTAYARYNRRM